MFANASSRSSSLTPSTWSNRASAFLTWEESVSGSFLCFGNAYALSGRLSRSAVSSSPCFVLGCHVVLIPFSFRAERALAGCLQRPESYELFDLVCEHCRNDLFAVWLASDEGLSHLQRLVDRYARRHRGLIRVYERVDHDRARRGE